MICRNAQYADKHRMLLQACVSCDDESRMNPGACPLLHKIEFVARKGTLSLQNGGRRIFFQIPIMGK